MRFQEIAFELIIVRPNRPWCSRSALCPWGRLEHPLSIWDRFCLGKKIISWISGLAFRQIGGLAAGHPRPPKGSEVGKRAPQKTKKTIGKTMFCDRRETYPPILIKPVEY